MKKGNTFLRFGVPFVVATAMLVLASFQTRPATLNAAPTPQVYVTNSGAAQAIPTTAHGTTAISGDVGITGTPTVNLGAGNTVGINGSVQVGNAATSPLFVRDVDNGARAAYQAAMSITFDPSDIVKHGEITAPAGKIFVVEFITAMSLLPNDQKVRLTFFVNDGLAIAQHFFAPTLVGTDFTQDVQTLSQPVKFYTRSCAGAGCYAIHVAATRFAGNTGSGSVQLSFAGYLLDE